MDNRITSSAVVNARSGCEVCVKVESGRNAPWGVLDHRQQVCVLNCGQETYYDSGGENLRSFLGPLYRATVVSQSSVPNVVD